MARPRKRRRFLPSSSQPMHLSGWTASVLVASAMWAHRPTSSLLPVSRKRPHVLKSAVKAYRNAISRNAIRVIHLMFIVEIVVCINDARFF